VLGGGALRCGRRAGEVRNHCGVEVAFIGAGDGR
jgi:hypothetical protein